MLASSLQTMANETTHFSISYTLSWHFPIKYIQFLQNENCKTAPVAGLLREIGDAVRILTTLRGKRRKSGNNDGEDDNLDLSLSQLATFD